MPTHRFARLAVALFLLLTAYCPAQQITVSADHADGVYSAGQTIHFKVDATGVTPPPDSVTYSLKRGGLTDAGSGKVELKDGVGQFDAKLDEPNTLLAEVRWGQGAISGLAARW